MGDNKPDFTGWASVNDQKCTDGRTIKSGAFEHMDKKKVPLIWQHQHNDSKAVLGYAILEHKAFGVFCHGYFNDTDAGIQAKLMVQHGDVDALSIFANNLKERRVGDGKDVYHGDIREVSLVLVGANPGAVIDNVNIVHGGDFIEVDSEAYIYNTQSLMHSDGSVIEAPAKKTKAKKKAKVDAAPNEEETVTPASNQGLFDSLTEEQGEVVHGLLHAALTHSDFDTDLDVNEVFDSFSEPQAFMIHSMIAQALEHSDNSSEGDINMGDNTLEHAGEKTVQDVFNSFTDEQKNVVYFLIGEAVNGEGGDSMAQSGLTEDDRDGFLAHIDSTLEKGFNEMHRNLFENAGTSTAGEKKTLSHDQLNTIMTEAKANGSLKDAVLAHAADYGFEDIGVLFPDAQNITNNPEFIKRRTEWVAEVLEGANTTPFSRIKSLFADITGDQARARGYVKGNLKKDEVVKLLKRVTQPTTVYKKQKLDRDDILDITSLDVVAWLKAEMRLMLDEEIARAILIGDGREVDDDDKIDEDAIRPIAYDSELFTHTITVASNASPNDIVESILRGRREYKGTGNPTFFTTDDVLTDLILQKDKINRRLYDTEESLAAALRVSKLVTVEVMADATDIIGVIVNMRDYTIGADAGGRLGMFDDFDINYNQYLYLIETRISGTLTKPKSAIVVKREQGTLVVPDQPSYNGSTHVVTIPSKTGVEYYINDTKVSSGPQAAFTESTTVEARPAAGYSFAHGTDADWYYAV